MPFIPAQWCVEVVMRGIMAGQTAINVFHLLNDIAPDETLLATINTTVETEWVDNIQELISAQYTLVSVKSTDLTSSSGASIENFLAIPQSGTAAGVGSVNNVALVISFRTDSRGRSFRGRNYIGGISANDRESPVEVTDAYLANFISGWVNFFTQVADSTETEHVILSRYHDGAARPSGVMTPVTEYTADSMFDSMRTRLEGRGS